MASRIIVQIFSDKFWAKEYSINGCYRKKDVSQGKG